jgi:hypothetical protein
MTMFDKLELVVPLNFRIPQDFSGLLRCYTEALLPERVRLARLRSLLIHLNR